MSDRQILILGRLEDIAPGTMREVEAAGQNILLVRQGDKITAIGARCPHAGGILAEGILTDGEVICPWHKAAFCVRTGKRLDPPAVDDLPSYRVEIENGDILLRDPQPAARPAPPPTADSGHFAILGAGAAGFAAAQELRRRGFGGAISLISPENELPYDRTILSKYVLAGQKAGEKSPLQEENFFTANRIDRITAKVTALDPRVRRITLEDGSSLAYDTALIATGGAVKPPPFPGAGLANVFTLRSPKDAQRIIHAAGTAGRAIVIGASFIGMEAAAALRERGLDVTVLDPHGAPFERQLGAAIGNVYRAIHEEKSVKFRFHSEVERIEGNIAVESVVLKNGERLPADLVIAGLGVRPATAFARTLTNGDDAALEVNARLQVTDGVYAAGDVAAFPIYGAGRHIRVEHWRVAEQQGMIAARNMAGGDEPYAAVPYFWTIQYMIRLDYVGHASGDDPVVIRGDPGERNFIAYYLRDGVVAAAAGMNRDADMAAIIALLNRRQDWTVETLHPENSSPAEILRMEEAAKPAL